MVQVLYTADELVIENDIFQYRDDEMEMYMCSECSERILMDWNVFIEDDHAKAPEGQSGEIWAIDRAAVDMVDAPQFCVFSIRHEDNTTVLFNFELSLKGEQRVSEHFAFGDAVRAHYGL